MKYLLTLSVVFCLCTASEDGIAFRYTRNELGTEDWKTTFPHCDGPMQSPINIEIANSVPKKYTNPLRTTNINVRPIEIEIVRTKFSATFNFYWACCAPHIYGGPLEGIYRFKNLHCHWGSDDEGSEHEINGKRYALECHLVFYNVRYASFNEAAKHSNGLAVFALLYTVSETANKSSLFQGIKHVKHTNDISRCFYPHTMALSDIIHMEAFPYASYTGSLTTPPCAESVTWVVMTTPLEILPEQLDAFHELEDDEEHQIEWNYRSLQPLNDRIVYTSA